MTLSDIVMSKPAFACIAVVVALEFAGVAWLTYDYNTAQQKIDNSLQNQGNHRSTAPQYAVFGSSFTQVDGDEDLKIEKSDSHRTASATSNLLADYLLSGDKADLEWAGRLYPEDRLIMLQSALLADWLDFVVLERLEAADSNNALPNLIRSSLYAESGNLDRFQEELKTAPGKQSVKLRQRRALILNRIIAEGIRELDPEIYTEFDADVLDRLKSAAKTLVRNPELFGGECCTAGCAMVFANNVHVMGGVRHGYGLVAGEVERNTLQRLDPQDEYGTDGQIMGQRLAELDRRVPALASESATLLISNRKSPGSAGETLKV